MRFVKAPHSACSAGDPGRDAIQSDAATHQALDQFLADWRKVA